MGRVKGMQTNPSRKSNETFGHFISNGIGDPYVDPGKYNLRGSSTAIKKPFVNMHGPRTVRKSEFEHQSPVRMTRTGEVQKGMSDTKRGFYNRKTTEPFTSLNGVGYVEDPYERKEDLGRDDYARLNSKIMYRGQPFSHVVR